VIDRIKKLALQALDRVDSSGNAVRWLLARGKGRPVQTAASYDLDRLRQRVDPPLQPSLALAPTLADIMDARDYQLMGKFHVPAEMAARMMSDDAIHVAVNARLAPLEAITVAIEPPDESAKSGRIAGHARPLFGPGGSACSPEDDKAINRDLANHGLAIGINQQWCPRPDGSGIDVVHKHWPLRDVEWDAGSERLVALVRVDGDPPPTAAPASIGRLGRYISSVPIDHGNGRWVVYQNQAHHSWQHDAAVLAGFLVWARHAFGASDWAAVSRSHGSPKWLGTMPENHHVQVASRDAQGEIIPGKTELSEQARAYLDLLADMASLAQPYGIQEFGSDTKLMVNSSTAWQVFSELMTNAEKAAARIWTGTDALMGAQGGAPGIDISALFGVASTIIQGDLGVITRARHTGVIVPWTALNYGTSARAPQRVYQIPDPDLQRAREQYIANEQAYVAMHSARKAAGVAVEELNRWSVEMAKRLDVQPIIVDPEQPAVNDVAPESGVQPVAA
jgi:hypothetical protein